MSQLTHLQNGIPVILNPMNWSRLVTIVAVIESSPRYETKENNGISHLVEHLLFQSRPDVSAAEIADRFDAMGATYNAFTSEAVTAITITVPAENIQLAVNELYQMITCPMAGTEEEFERQREVILNEIRESEDDAFHVLLTLSESTAFPGSSYSLPVAGTEESLMSITYEDTQAWKATHYGASSITISVAGGTAMPLLVHALYRFSQWGSLAPNHKSLFETPRYFAGGLYEPRNFGQAYVSVSYPCEGRESEDWMSGVMVAKIVGSGMGSRLFRTIREKQGLAYSVGTIPDIKQVGGLMLNYAVTDNAEAVIESIKQIVTRVSDTLTEDEVARAKAAIKGSFLPEYEHGGKVATYAGFQYHVFRTLFEQEDFFGRIDNTTLKSIRDYAEETFLGCSPSIVSLRPV